MVLAPLLKYYQLSLHWQWNFLYLILSTVSTCTMILLNILNTNNFQFIHNGTYSSFEILSTVSTYTIILLYMCSTTFSSSTIWYLFYRKFEILSTVSTSTNILPLPLMYLHIISEILPIFSTTTKILVLSLYLWSTVNCMDIENGITYPLMYWQLSAHLQWY